LESFPTSVPTETVEDPLPVPAEEPLSIPTEFDWDRWPFPFSGDSALTTLNDGPLKHVASAEPSWYTMTVYGPRVSVSTGVQSAPEVPAATGLCMICDWQLWDADVLWSEDRAVGAAVQPANAGWAPPSTMTETTVPVVAARPASDPMVTLGEERAQVFLELIIHV
jgi:hypothetical protein